MLRDRNEEITKRFGELDRDHNGVLSPDEVTAVIRDTMGYDHRSTGRPTGRVTRRESTREEKKRLFVRKDSANLRRHKHDLYTR